MTDRVKPPEEVDSRVAILDRSEIQCLDEIEMLKRDIGEISDSIRNSAEGVSDEVNDLFDQLREKKDRLEYLEALGRFSDEELEQLKSAFKRGQFERSYSLKDEYTFENVVIEASASPNYFSIEDIIFCLSSDDRSLQPRNIQNVYPFLEEYEGFPVSMRVGLHGSAAERKREGGFSISPEEANRYLDLAKTGRFTGFGIVCFYRDGISPEVVSGYDEKFDELEIYRLALSNVSNDRALELTDRQLDLVGVTVKGQNPGLIKQLANWGFMFKQMLRGYGRIE